MDVDDYLKVCGVMGSHTIRILAINFIVHMTIAQQMYAMIFLEYTPEYTCVDMYGNDTIQNKSYVTFTSGQCEYTIEDNSILLNKSCTTFKYDQKYLTETIVTQNNLVCDKTYLVSVIRMVAMGFGAAGGLIMSYISDRFGRKVISVVCMICCGVFGCLLASSVNIEMYATIKAINSFIGFAGLVPMTMLVMESVAPNRRAAVTNFVAYAWPIGASLLSLYGYLVDTWWQLQLLASIPILISGISAIWLVDKSPHWLATMNRKEECMEVLERIKRRNGVVTDLIFEPDQLKTPSADEKKPVKEGLVKIFKHCRLLTRFLIITFGWWACSLCYYVLAYGVSNIPGDLFVNNALMSLVEILSYSYCMLMQCFGRKWLGVAAMSLGGATLLISGIIMVYRSDLALVVTIMSIGGKFSVSAAWEIIFLWGSEIWPTEHRTKLSSYNRLGSEVGSLMAPPFIDLPKYIDIPNEGLIVPLIIATLMFICAALHAIFVPDTFNCKLPENMHEANAVSFQKIDNEEVAAEGEDDKFIDPEDQEHEQPI